MEENNHFSFKILLISYEITESESSYFQPFPIL